MKIRKIHIVNILSYGDETIELNNDLNIFVGANGSGKSNFMNIIIYILKRFCFRNYEINNINGPERIGIKKYYIRQKNPLYGLDEDYFLQKHKLKTEEKSLIELTINFEENDANNLREIKSKKEQICEFIDRCVDNINFMDDKHSIDKNQVKEFFEINEKDLKINTDIILNICETENGWTVQGGDNKYCIYMKYFSLMLEILNLNNISHNVKNPFIFFEAYRNNSSESTKVGIMEYDNQQYINLQSLPNISSLNYSIGTNSTYIMLATKKYGIMLRNAIEKENGIEEFHNSEDYIRLKKFFEKFEYNIDLKCIYPENNIYQFYIEKDGLKIEIDTISSGEREIINFIFGLFLDELNDGIVIIDEPEIHLHPNWQKKLIQILKEETQNKNIQILFATHSSSFIAYNMLNNIFRIYKENGFSKSIKINDLLQDNNDELRKKLSVINATNNEKIFFSNYVILVEGITDEILFKKIYESEIGKIPDGVEFVNINGKNNLENFENVLDKLRIRHFYIGDYDNLYGVEELKDLFEINRKDQNKDLKRNKNQSYSALDLLDSIEAFIMENNEENFDKLKENYSLYNEKFLRKKHSLSEKEKQRVTDYIKEKYEENFYILLLGEIENYIGTSNSKKAVGFTKVISFLTDNEEYETFCQTEGFEELKTIINKIHSTIMNEQ